MNSLEVFPPVTGTAQMRVMCLKRQVPTQHPKEEKRHTKLLLDLIHFLLCDLVLELCLSARSI